MTRSVYMSYGQLLVDPKDMDPKKGLKKGLPHISYGILCPGLDMILLSIVLTVAHVVVVKSKVELPHPTSSTAQTATPGSDSDAAQKPIGSELPA